MSKSKTTDERLKPLKDLLASAETFISPHRSKWQAIYDQVYKGTPFDDLEDWQASFSLPTLNSAVSDCKTDLVGILLNHEDWYDLDEANPDDLEAKALKTPLKKLLEYHLVSSNFKSYASSLIGAALLGVGDTAVHWHQRKILNPDYITWKSRKTSKSPSDQLAQYASMTPEDIASQLESVGQDLEGFVNGNLANPEPPKYISVGVLRYDMPHFNKTYWDPKAVTINASRWRAYDFELNDYELLEYAKQGTFKMSAVKELLKTKGKSGMYTITCYYGPDIRLDNDGHRYVHDEGYYCIWCNNVVLISGDYPYLEVTEQKHPMVTAVAKPVPFSNCGQAPAEYATEMARWHDHNWRIMCDQLRFGLLGFNAVDQSRIMNKEIIDNGLEPGSLLQVTGNPNEVFSHISLTSNRESQNQPVNEVLRTNIVQAVGTAGVGAGSSLKSRTTSAEVEAIMASSSKAVAAIAVELQETFVLPVLKKIFARVVQFGIKDLSNNTEAAAVLTQEELRLLGSLDEAAQVNILQTFYRFNVRAYKSKQEDLDLLENLARLIQSGDNNPYFQQSLHYKKIITLYTELLGLAKNKLIIETPSEHDVITAENMLLEQGKFVEIGANDNHEMHMQMQQPGPDANQFALEHFQQHQMALEQSQQVRDQELQSGIR